MTTEQKNREVTEWLGICWHEWDWRETSYRCTKCNSYLRDIPVPTHPDFSQGAGIVRLLEEMMKREDWDDFSKQIGFWSVGFRPLKIRYFYLRSDYITTPGKLLKAVWEWFKGRER
jgi:hypothetical protein